MVSLTTADNALKTLYLGVLAEQLNTGVNAFLAKIQQTTADVWGKNIVKLAPYGINGGIGACNETGMLPAAGGNNYAQFVLSLKNLYGTIEITDKAMLASENSQGAFVNLLNAEMEGLLQASKFNLGRMTYGDGSGKLAKIVSQNTTDRTIITVDGVKNLMEGMIIDFYSIAGSLYSQGKAKTIESIDRATNTIKIAGTSTQTYSANDFICLQSSYNQEITGLTAIFDGASLYGLSKSGNAWLIPYKKDSAGAINTNMMQIAMDNIETLSGGSADIIVTGYDVRRYYVDYLAKNRSNVDYLNLDGGYKALSFSGIPLVADRFVNDGTMYILNSENFRFHQLCDWRWLESDQGKVIRQKPDYAAYTATLVKYADLLCERPNGQARLTGITAAA